MSEALHCERMSRGVWKYLDEFSTSWPSGRMLALYAVGRGSIPG